MKTLLSMWFDGDICRGEFLSRVFDQLETLQVSEVLQQLPAEFHADFLEMLHGSASSDFISFSSAGVPLPISPQALERARAWHLLGSL